MVKQDTVAKSNTNTSVGPVIDYGDHSGAGFERQTADDMAMPFINVLQTNSPQASKANKDAYINGAEAGMFMNTVTEELIDGEKGITFVPVSTEHCYVKWVPRSEGGGFRGKLEITSPEATETLSSGRKNEKGIPLTKDGLEMKETFYIYGLTISEVGAEEYDNIVVIPFVSSKIKAYKNYMSKIRQHKRLSKAPLYCHQATMTTFGDRKGDDTFFNVEIAPAINDGADAILASALPAGHPMLNIGREMLESILSGARTAAYNSVSGSAAEDEDAAF